jgi:UDP-GlcNAc3NAcA epimerase
MSLKLTSVVGARPQFIKVAAVSRAIHAHNRAGGQPIQDTLIHTGQHYDEDMSGVFFTQLGLSEPARNLGVGSGTHAEQTGAMLRGLESCFREDRPDLVLIYGDTNSTLAAALAAAKLCVPLAHVEAGLRSRNMAMPEEINRIVADKLSDFLFTATEAAQRNLAEEGLSDKIRVVGDVMFDSIRLFQDAARNLGDPLSRFGLIPGGYALATIHRAENTDRPDRLRAIFDGLAKVAGRIPTFLLLHPRTRAALTRLNLGYDSDLHIGAPVPFFEMMALEAGARLILTDSGGVQKEAYFHGVPCVTIRTETEWVETVESGWNRLAEASPAAITAVADAMLNFDRSSPRPDFYGDGHAAEKIVRELLAWRGISASQPA